MKKKTATGILVVLLVIYLIGVFIYSFYTWPGTTVNGAEIGMVNQSEVYDKDLTGFELTIKGKDGRVAKIPARSINYTVTLPEDFDFHQNAFLWPVEIFRDHDIKFVSDSNFNEERLKELLQSSALFQNTDDPQNAYVDYVDGKYKIVEEKEGNTPDMEKLYPEVLESFDNMQEVLQLTDEYKEPEIRSDDKELIALRDHLNEIAKIAVTIDLDYTKYELKGQELLNIYDRDGTDLSLNKDRLRNYIRNIAVETDTFGSDREFETTGRGIVTVKGGIYGWQIDVDKTMDEVLAAIENKESKTIKPVYIHEGLTRTEDDDIGDTYIEIDLTRQHMWYYKDGELLVETDVVTGDPTKDHATPTGTDKIWSREQDRTLRGTNFGSGSEYAVKVNYWMPINWNGIGIHDTGYRDAYGGEIYKGNGSHGCINTPPDKVGKIFENVVNNTPVVIYES